MRRKLMYRIILPMALLGIVLLSGGCSEKEQEAGPMPKEVVFYNWKDFTDRTILNDFEKETGIKVILKEYETRDMCIAQLQTNPGLCDVLILDTYNFPYLKNQKLIREFDLEKIPNANLVDEEVKRSLANENIYNNPPYLTGTNGMIINTNYVPADTDGWSVFKDSRYKNRIMLLDDLREALVPLLSMSGLSINATKPQNFDLVEKNAMLLKNNGIVFGETFTNLDKMLNGEKWIAQTYNGDFVYKTKGRNEFKFIFPKEGFMKWIVIFALHNDAENPEGAHAFVNFMLRPDIAARSATTYSYRAPIKGVEKFLDDDFADNKIVNPPENVLQRADLGQDLGENLSRFQKIFNMMKN